MGRYTLADVKAMTDDIITPAIAASVLKQDPQELRIQARCDPDSLGFPVAVVGSRVKIPREAFVKFMTGGSLNESNAMQTL